MKMKRKMMVILTCTGLAGALLVSSCKKSEVSKKDQTLDSLIGKATITGIVKLDYDRTQKATLQAKEVAAGAIISVSYKSSDLAYKSDPSAITYNTYDKTVNTTTDANGKFTITVDANANGIGYIIQQAQFSGTWVNPADTVSQKAYYSPVSTPISLKKGDNLYIELTYSSTPQYTIPN